MRKYQPIFFFLLYFFPFVSNAQLWPGNLGRPIVNVDFGAGRGAALAAGETNYKFTGGCPKPGEYSIEHFLFGCATGTWVQMVGDHTGDHDGNYMLVNAAGKPGTVFQRTVDGLCGGTTYQLSAFISTALNALACSGRPELPNLTLSIENTSGDVLASANAGDIPVADSKTFKIYGTYYTMPAVPIPIVIKISSNGTAACGSAFLVDDITLRAAGPDVQVKINGSDNTEVNVCVGNVSSIRMIATVGNGFTDAALQWQQSIDTGKTWTDITGANGTAYTVPNREKGLVLYQLVVAEKSNIGNLNCSVVSPAVRTNVYPLPEHTSLQQVLACLGKPFSLVPSPEFSEYVWKGPNGFQSNDALLSIPNISAANAGLYTVQLTGYAGCTVTDSFQVSIYPGTTVTATPEYNVCEDTWVTLAASGNGSFAWSPATGLSDTSIANPAVVAKDSARYQVILTNSYGCKDTAMVKLNVYKKAFADAGDDKTILAGDTVILNGTIKGSDISYTWSPAIALVNSNTTTPLASPAAETTYTLSVNSNAGCGSSSDQVTVKVYKDIFAPNAFSPNADGLNDIYYPPLISSYQLLSFSIYNRNGYRIFYTKNAGEGWDGTIKGNPQDAGAYVYYVSLKSPAGRIVNRKGTIMLLK